MQLTEHPTIVSDMPFLCEVLLMDLQPSVSYRHLQLPGPRASTGQDDPFNGPFMADSRPHQPCRHAVHTGELQQGVQDTNDDGEAAVRTQVSHCGPAGVPSTLPLAKVAGRSHDAWTTAMQVSQNFVQFTKSSQRASSTDPIYIVYLSGLCLPVQMRPHYFTPLCNMDHLRSLVFSMLYMSCLDCQVVDCIWVLCSCLWVVLLGLWVIFIHGFHDAETWLGQGRFPPPSLVCMMVVIGQCGCLCTVPMTNEMGWYLHLGLTYTHGDFGSGLLA